MNWGVLAWLFLGVKFAVTAYYGADVDAHRAAYLTAVLALFAFAALAAAVDVWNRRADRNWRKALRVPPLFVLAARQVFLAVRGVGRVGAPGRRRDRRRVLRTGARRVDRHPGVRRSTEFRLVSFEFADKLSEHEWEKLKTADLPILVPISSRVERPAHKRRSRCGRGTAFRARCRSCS